MAPDLLDVIADGVRGATADLSAIANSLGHLSYLSPSEARRLEDVLAGADSQLQRVRTRISAITGDRE